MSSLHSAGDCFARAHVFFIAFAFDFIGSGVRPIPEREERMLVGLEADMLYSSSVPLHRVSAQYIDATELACSVRIGKICSSSFFENSKQPF